MKGAVVGGLLGRWMRVQTPAPGPHGTDPPAETESLQEHHG